MGVCVGAFSTWLLSGRLGEMGGGEGCRRRATKERKEKKPLSTEVLNPFLGGGGGNPPKVGGGKALVGGWQEGPPLPQGRPGGKGVDVVQKNWVGNL